MKRIVIVGATSGIGLEVARLCIRAGWRVGAAGRRKEALEALRSEAPGQVETETIDITRDDAPERLARLVERLGGMEIYFHASGIGSRNTALRNWRIPSMSLQTLVENAVKHNSITGGNPLHIRIRTEGESFLIENNYTPRSDGDKESLGMGLERIRSVYRFYTEENISISVGDGTFRCRLPLLPPEK